MLRRRIDSHALIGDIGYGDVRLHGVGIGHGKIVIALDHRGCFLECFLDVTPLDFVSLADIRSLARGHFTFETAQRPRFEFLFVQERGVFRHRFFRREDAFQFFILDVDKFQRFEGGSFIDRHHGGHRLAGVTHFFNRQQRMIFDRVAEIGIQPVEIVAGDDAINAWMPFGA